MKKDLFQSCGHCWLFQISWHIECSPFTASSLRIWNSSTGIPSPPLTLFVVMLPKAHLTSHSRMSGSRWVRVITPSWSSGSWRSVLYRSVYSCHLFLICSASVRSISFLYFIEPIFAWNVPLVYLIFLKRSLVFPILLFSSISLHWSLRKAFFSLLAILWNSAFRWEYLPFSPLFFASLLFTAIYKASSVSWGWSWSLSPVQCHKPPSIVHQALCLSGLIPYMYFPLPLYNHKGFYLGHTWMLLVFPTFFNSEFDNKEFMIWATVSSQSCFCCLYRASPSLAAKNIINLTLVLSIWWCPCVKSSLVLLEEGVCYDQDILLAKLY